MRKSILIVAALMLTAVYSCKREEIVAQKSRTFDVESLVNDSDFQFIVSGSNRLVTTFMHHSQDDKDFLQEYSALANDPEITEEKAEREGEKFAQVIGYKNSSEVRDYFVDFNKSNMSLKEKFGFTFEDFNSNFSLEEREILELAVQKHITSVNLDRNGWCEFGCYSLSAVEAAAITGVSAFAFMGCSTALLAGPFGLTPYAWCMVTIGAEFTSAIATVVATTYACLEESCNTTVIHGTDGG